jgi:hypothetical protein
VISMDFTWIAILASLAMGIGTALIFVFAVKGNHFQNFEDAKYQVFWSDLEEPVDAPKKEGTDGEGAKNSGRAGERRSDH